MARSIAVGAARAFPAGTATRADASPFRGRHRRLARGERRRPLPTTTKALARPRIAEEAAGDGDEDTSRSDTAGDDDAATVAPSPPSLLPPPIDEAGLGEMDERDLRAALMDTARRLEAAQDELLCQICFTDRRDALIMPCLHLLYCRRCVDRSSEANERRGLPDRCPCCRTSVGGVLRCKRL